MEVEKTPDSLNIRVVVRGSIDLFYPSVFKQPAPALAYKPPEEIKQITEEILHSPYVSPKIKSDLIADINDFTSASMTLLTTAKTIDPTVSTVEEAKALATQAPEVLAKPVVRFEGVETKLFKTTEGLKGLPIATKKKLKSILKKPKKASPVKQIIQSPTVSAETKAIATDAAATIADASAALVEAAQTISPEVKTVEEAKILAQQVPEVLAEPVAMLIDTEAEAVNIVAQQPDARAILRQQFVENFGKAEGKRVQYEYNRILATIDSGDYNEMDVAKLKKLIANRERLTAIQTRFAEEKQIQENIDAFREQQADPAVSIDDVLVNYERALIDYNKTLALYQQYMNEIYPFKQSFTPEMQARNDVIREKMETNQLANLSTEIRLLANDVRKTTPVTFGKDKLSCKLGVYTCLGGYELQKNLGGGSYGAVYAACLKSDCKYAVKIQRYNKEFLNEVEVFIKLQGWPGMQLFAHSKCNALCNKSLIEVGVLVMEQWDGNLTSQEAFAYAVINWEQCVKQLGDQIRYLHNVGYIHWDLHHRNVLYKGGPKFSIADFGLCNDISNPVPFGFNAQERDIMLQQFPAVMTAVNPVIGVYSPVNIYELAVATKWFIVDYYLVMEIILSTTFPANVKFVVLTQFLQQQQHTRPIIQSIR